MIFGASRPRRARVSSRDRRPPEQTYVAEELPPKLIPSLRLLLSTGVALAHTRVALAGIELEEELQRLISAAALALTSLLLVSLALVVGTFTIVAAVAPEHRVVTMVIITAVYVLIALGLLLKLKGIFTNRPPIFAATLAELEKDKETLSQMSRAHEAAEEARERDRARRTDEEAAVRAATSPTPASGAN